MDCTTSYFSPAIHLAEHNVPFRTFFSTVEPVGAWQRQIEAVLAGRVDATMVEEGIWLGKPANQAQTKIIGSVDGLPGQ
jgi:phosphonate transport system substrate-binding protein